MIETLKATPENFPLSSSEPLNVLSNPTNLINSQSESPAPSSSKNLSFLQLNCHSSKATTQSVVNTSLDFDFLILQEPWVNPVTLEPPQHKAWRCFLAFEHRPTKWQERHKAVIYIQKFIPTEHIKILCGGSQLIMGVEISLPNCKTFRLINIYNPPDKFPAVDELTRWLTTNNSRKIATFLCMDSNLHHQHWNPPGCRKRKPESLSLLSSLSNFGFRISSPKHIPTFYSSRCLSGTTIDLIWANFLGSKLVDEVQVSNNNHGSDHQALILWLNLGKPVPVYHWRLPDWEDMRLKKTPRQPAELSPSFFQDINDPNELATAVTDSIKCLQEKLGKRVRSNRAKAKPWWCHKTLDPVVNMRNRARRWMILTKSPEAAQCYKQWNDHFHSLVDFLKQRSWRKLLESPLDDDLFGVLRFSKQSAAGGILPLRDASGILQHDRERQAQLLFEGTSVIASPVDLSDIVPYHNVRFSCYPEVQLKEVDYAIQKIRPRKAAGIDGIANEMIKFFSPAISPILTILFNHIFTGHVFPSAWKVAVTAIIRKQGKPDYTSPSAYRPIALLSTAGKIFEIIIARRLTLWAEENQIIAPSHFGGRKGSGTEDALFSLETWTRRKWREGKVVCALFLDVKSAYPSVYPARLIDSLFKMKCPTYLVLMIANFLSDRSTAIRLDDYTSPAFNLAIGLPQGSPLSVILYILYNNELLNKDFSLDQDLVSIGYVDDVVHLVAHQSPSSAKSLLTKEGFRSLQWGLKHGAFFDQAKAQFMWFTQGLTPGGILAFGSQKLTASPEVKWLGIWLDSKLHFDKNFKVLGDKIAKTIQQLKIFGSSRWGSGERHRARLVKCVLIPRITYGAAIWATVPNKHRIAELAAKADRAAGKFVLGTFKTTSLQFIRDHSPSPLIYNEILKSCFAFFFRKMNTVKVNNLVRDLLFNSRSEAHRSHPSAAITSIAFPLINQAMKLSPEEIVINFDFGQISSRPVDYFNENTSKDDAVNTIRGVISSFSSDRSVFFIFCDGSFHPIKGGAGAAVCPQLHISKSIACGVNPALSNHESEAFGLLAALELANEISQKICISRIFIVTDNKGVMERTKDLKTPKPGQYIFQMIGSVLSDIPKEIRITFAWCPGHRDVQGNELADKLAKEAVERNSSPDVHGKGNYTKTQKITLGPLVPKRRDASKLPIAYSSLINQLISGHCPLNRFLFRIKRATDPLCKFCPCRETVTHLMNFCPHYRLARRDFRRSLRTSKIGFNPNYLDRTLHIWEAHPHIADFLRKTGRFPELLSAPVLPLAPTILPEKRRTRSSSCVI